MAVVVVGAGLAGLSCAVRLAEAGAPVQVVEAADEVGGRVRTDRSEGFLLDRGFQIYLTAYPEGSALLDHSALDLQAFAPGALVRAGGRFHRVGDPLRRAGDLLPTLRAPIGTAADKLRIARLRWSGDTKRDVTTKEELTALGFSPRIIDRFLGPLFTGIQLDPGLGAPGKVFRFLFSMLAGGDAAVPAAGMQALPDQLAGRLPPETVRLSTPVAAVSAREVVLESGERLAADSVVVATDGPVAARLTGIADPGSRAVTAVYFAADEPPVGEPIIVLDGDASGPATNVAEMSTVAPSYAPPGATLVVAACVPGDAPNLEDAVRSQLRGWFGGGVDSWEHLRTYRIPHAHPAQRPPWSEQAARHESGVLLAGDHRDSASINGALASGRRAADAALGKLSP